LVDVRALDCVSVDDSKRDVPREVAHRRIDKIAYVAELVWVLHSEFVPKLVDDVMREPNSLPWLANAVAPREIPLAK
jgi:hypothetical protein